ncbi:hypothetical protein BH11VER1_BH11VER1_01300 [soil metagenome]
MNLFSFKAALPAILASNLLAVVLHAAPPVTPPATPTLDPSSHAAHVAAGTMPPDAPKGAPTITELQAKVAQLEAALAKGAPTTAAAPAGAAMPGMPAAGATPPAGPMAGMAMPPAGPMAGMAIPAAGAAPDPAMAGMGGGGGMMGMMDKMMGMMDKMMSMEGGAMPMGGAQMAPAAPGGMGKGMDMDKMKMGGMGKGMDMGMDKMKMGGMGMMAMDKMKMAGMMGMPPMGGDAPEAMPQSALPGFPGASHLYHLGATGFFLDHATHIALTTEQTAALNQAKEKAALAKSTADRAIAQAEQELWTLTSSDQPDIAAIEAKTAEIGKLTAQTRVAFIRAVGEASKLLTDGQRKILTGFAPPATTAPAAAMAPMKGM